MKLPLALARRGRLDSPYLRNADPTFVWHADKGLSLAKPGGSLTLSGNEITDAVRAAGAQGDGRAVPDGSFGIWEATTNLIKNGGFETNLDNWTAIDAGVRTRVTADKKFGAACCEVNTTDATDGVQYDDGALEATQGKTYTISAWLKAKAAGDVGKTVTALAQSSGGVFEIFTNTYVLTADWVRHTWQVTWAEAAHTKATLQWRDNSGQGGFDFYVDGVQYEEQPIATPYIETDGATAARAGAVVTAPSSVFTETQGWCAMLIRQGWAASPAGPNIHMDWADAPLTRVVLRMQVTTTKLEVATGSGTAQATFAAPVVVGTLYLLIGKWDADNVYASAEGGAFVSAARVGDGPPNNPAATFSLGRWFGGDNYHMDGDILWAACGKGTLSDADAAYIAAKYKENFRWFSGWQH